MILGAVSWVGYLLYDQISPTATGAPTWSSDDEKVVRAVRIRRQVHLAQVPWTLDIANPEDALVAGAALPWKNLPLPGPDGAGGVTLASLNLPTFPRRLAADEPIELKLASANLPEFPRRIAADEPVALSAPAAEIPWSNRTLGDQPAHVSLALLPHLKRIPDPAHPDSILIAESRIPWLRSADDLAPVSLKSAEVPSIKPLAPDPKPDQVEVSPVKSPLGLRPSDQRQSSTQSEEREP